ncbi:ABC transporter substrate-binding protein [Roseinatronobacter alkalisoli]|uniref:ABC transporter substrate-binding protein n=1 Tax=Roseinatronobacter alkalisoli TaxID=3028235 RepID=A0ABT5TDP2_9RHOB|nr:ABC transporter substrate-binding protein [Roseinatronobacter sp. HJB301]MDD7973241.1 ABC transporter substrate-binding protein [Roseinatronobacter sp. HJB301]
MQTLTKRAIAGTLLSTTFLVTGLSSALIAQEATMVLPAREVGAPSYDPIRGTKLNVATTLIYDRMVLQDADQSYHGQLATAWETSEDGMTWTFTLRPDVTFHDGEPFNAETIAWWVPQFEGTENAFMTEAIESVEIVDDLTVRFIMKNPDPNLLSNMASSFMGVPSPKAYEELGDQYGVTGAIGTGPFILESYTVGQDTVLVRNEAYSAASALSVNQGPPHLARLTFREIGDDSTAFLEMRTGGVDMLLSVPADFRSMLDNESDVTMVTLPGRELFYMPINTTVAPFDDIRVREATALAVNQAEIVDNLYGGLGAAADTFLNDSLLESNVDDALRISYNPERAQALLDEAGWVVGTNGVRAKDGQALNVKLWTQNGTEFRRITEVIQAQLIAVGINADITVLDPSSINAEYRKGTEHQLAVRSYSWENADILDWFFSSDRIGYPNVSMWDDEPAEEMRILAMTGSRTWDERVANFTAYHEYVLTQFVFAPIYQPVQSFAYSSTTLSVPEQIRSTRVQSQTFLDIDVK